VPLTTATRLMHKIAAVRTALDTGASHENIGRRG
jgi:hypothetical protein